MEKIIPYFKIKTHLGSISKNKKKIVLCHGKFDFLHYGHFAHLKQAKKQGEILIVSITSKKNKYDNVKIFFDDKTRANRIAELDFVDYVTISPYPNAYPVIIDIKPNIYCKGIEYKNYTDFPNKELMQDIYAAKKINCKVKFVGDKLLSSSELINKKFKKDIVKEYKKNIPENFNFDLLEKIFKDLKKLKVLIVGDYISDKYTYVETKGLASKNYILSCVYKRSESYNGGAASSYFHLNDFVKKVTFCSIANKKDSSNFNKIKDSKIFYDKYFQTVIKEKFVEETDSGAELKKYFALNKVTQNFYSKPIEDIILNYLNNNIKKYDLVLALDFGHGFFTKKIIDLLIKRSAFLSVNCQTNSLNYGFNILGNKFSKADCFTLDKIEFNFTQKNNYITNYENELKKLKNSLNAKYGWLTAGREFTLGVDHKNNFSKIDVLSKSVKDSIGAGDAFFSLASILACNKVDLGLSTFLSQVAGSIQTNTVSNKEYLNRDKIINFIKEIY